MNWRFVARFLFLGLVVIAGELFYWVMILASVNRAPGQILPW